MEVMEVCVCVSVILFSSMFEARRIEVSKVLKKALTLS